MDLHSIAESCTALSTALCGTYKSSERQVGCDTDQW